MPSGYSYSTILGLYYYEEVTTVYNSLAGSYTETVTDYYWDCDTNTYTSSAISTIYIDYCDLVNIPSGYVYDESSELYSYSTESSSTESSSGFFIVTVTTYFYDC